MLLTAIKCITNVLKQRVQQNIPETLATLSQTRMWANAQRDGHPAKYRWRPLLNAAKFAWRTLLECCAVTLPI